MVLNGKRCDPPIASLYGLHGDGVGTTDGAELGLVVVFDTFDFTDFGIPHNFDSVLFTKFSFGLFGLHIAAFCWGVNDDMDDDVLLLPWPWATLKIPNPVIVTIVGAKTIDIDVALKHAPFLLVMVLVNEP